MEGTAEQERDVRPGGRGDSGGAAGDGSARGRAGDRVARARARAYLDLWESHVVHTALYGPVASWRQPKS